MPTFGQNCPVKIMNKYNGHRPPKASAFYCRPLPTTVNYKQQRKWYSVALIGKNTIDNTVKTIAEKAGWDFTKL